MYCLHSRLFGISVFFFSANSIWEALIWSFSIWKAFPINTNKGPLDCLSKYDDIFYHEQFYLSSRITDSFLVACYLNVTILYTSYKQLLGVLLKFDLRAEIFVLVKMSVFVWKNLASTHFRCIVCSLAHCSILNIFHFVWLWKEERISVYSVLAVHGITAIFS